MKRWWIGVVLGVALLFSYGCGGRSASISLPKGAYDALTKTTPSEQYVFYVSKDHVPAAVKDLASRILVVIHPSKLTTANVSEEFLGVDVASCALNDTGAPLFKGAECYFIASNVTSAQPDKPCMTTESDATMKTDKATFPFPAKTSWYGKSANPQVLYAKGMELMKANPSTTVLLTERSAKFDGQGDLVEVQFTGEGI